MVLRHDAFHLDPRIPQLEGICWDITPARSANHTDEGDHDLGRDDKIWPVLVFQATRYGDLQSFLMMSEEKALSATERLELCLTCRTTVSHQ